MKSFKSILPTLIIALLLITSITTGALLLAKNPCHAGEPEAEATSSVYILGPARKLLSQGLYERADVYFHKGAPRHRDEAFQSIFQRWKKEITPGLHAHAHGNEISEILPWLRLASQSDPHNIELFLVASFWLAGECGEPDLALQALTEALEKNPGRYELFLEQSRVYLSIDEYDHALRALEQARKLITTTRQADPEQVALDKPFILMALSYLYETAQDRDKAIDATKAYLKTQNSPHLTLRLKELRAGKLDSEAARTRLRELFHKEHQCDRDEHEHDCGCNDCSSPEAHVHGPDCNH